MLYMETIGGFLVEVNDDGHAAIYEEERERMRCWLVPVDKLLYNLRNGDRIVDCSDELVELAHYIVQYGDELNA